MIIMDNPLQTNGSKSWICKQLGGDDGDDEGDIFFRYEINFYLN